MGDRWLLTLAAGAFVGAGVASRSLEGLFLITVGLVMGVAAGLVWTREGSVGRAVVRGAAVVAGLGVGGVGVAALGLSGWLVTRLARGDALGFGGVFILVGIPVGLGLVAGGWTLLVFAWAGGRRWGRGSSGPS